MSEKTKSKSLKDLYPEKYQNFLNSEKYKLRNRIQKESNYQKEVCKKEANYTCAHCGQPALDSHHIIPLDQGGPDTQDNLICLCRKCQQQVHCGVYTVDLKTKTLLPVINQAHVVEEKPDYIKAFEEKNNLTLYKSTAGWYAFIDNIKTFFTITEIKEAINYKHIKYHRNEHYHEVAKMKNELTKASKEMRWEQGKEIRKFIRFYEDKRDYEILVKLYKAIVEEK